MAPQFSLLPTLANAGKERETGMNDARRKVLTKALALISEGKSLVEEIMNDEREAFDNMPEGLQQGERGQAAEAAADALEEAFGNLEEAEGNIETASE